MKRRRKHLHSVHEAPPDQPPAPSLIDHTDQIPLDLASATSPPMTSTHDDTFTATATDCAADLVTDDSSSTASGADLFASDESVGRELFVMPAASDASSPTLGSRLRAAREDRHWSIDEVATRLRLPQRVIATLEAGDFARIEHDVYLRGYLVSYSRLLGVSADDLLSEFRERGPSMPALVATGRISHSRYLFQRYSVPTVYVILTGLIVAPAVWLATHGGLDQNLARLAPLEQSLTLEPAGAAPETVVSRDVAANSVAADAAGRPAPVAVPPVDTASPVASELPLMASMVPGMKHETPVAPAAFPAPTGSYQVNLRLKDASWVELVGADGQRIEFGLLPAGSDKAYSLQQAASIRVGNASSAELTVNGKPVDLTPFRRANVAHLKLANGAPVPAAGDN